MKKLKFSSIFSSILAFVMVFSLLSPITASANDGEWTQFKQNGLDESTLALKKAIFEQLELSEDAPKLHSELQNLSGDEEVGVIIHLSEKPVALEMGISSLSGETLTSSEEAKITKKVQQQQASVTKEMAVKGISYEKGFTYDTVLNGFSAKVKADDVAKLVNIKGVTLVEPDTIVYASSIEGGKSTSPFTNKGEVEAAMNTSIDFLGIKKLWDEGYEGKGIKVAVLDTGIDVHHPEFEGIFKGGKNFIANSATYTKERSEDDVSETLPSERPEGSLEVNASGRTFYTDHGTHVAGTIAAIGANPYGVKGIAPKVDLYAYRVLGAYGSGTTSGIIAAIDYAVVQDMDIINLSLGGGANTETAADSYAINNAMMAGTIGVVATGNSGPNRGTMGTPSTARLGIAVGNTTNPETMYNAQVNITAEDYEYSKQLELMATPFGQDLATQLEGKFELVAIPGNAEAKDFEGIDVKGKVALISRGSIAFVDKIANAKDNGAVATIIHNFAGGTNAPGPSNTFLGDAFNYLPTFDMSVTDGAEIREVLANGTATVTFGNYKSVSTLGDEVWSSSSRGPSTPNFDIKPDVTAPGTNIMSSIPMYKADFPDADYSQAYDRFTGTSMAAPHITGIVALILEANPKWSPFDVKVALSNTAKVLDTTKYDVFDQGAGRVDAYAAAHPSFLAYSIDTAVQNATGTIVENLKGTVTFGPQKLDEDISVTKEIRVKDFSGKGGTYTVNVSPTKEFKDAKLTVSEPTFTLEPNGEKLLEVTLTASKATTKAGDEFLGYIEISTGEKEKVVTSLSVDQTDLSLTAGTSKQFVVTETTSVVNDYKAVTLPFAADFAAIAPTEIKNVSISKTDLSFNGDGINDTADLYWTNTGNLGFTLIEVYDYYGDDFIGYIDGGTSIPRGSYELPINGEYLNYTTEEVEIIPDGIYTIDINAYDNNLAEWTEPVFVKTTKPEVAASFSEGKVTGKVTDKYIEYIEYMAKYKFVYEINSKLKASFVVSGQSKTIQLNDDGTFEFDVDADYNNEPIVITVVDAAGNTSNPFVINEEATTTADSITVTVEETTTTVETEENTVFTKTLPTLTKVADYNTINTVSNVFNEGGIDRSTFSTGIDVTKDASYSVEDSSIATVSEEGLVTAKKAGETTITVTYGENTVTVNVKVAAPYVPAPSAPSAPSAPAPSAPSAPAPAPSTPAGEVNVDANTIASQVKDSTKEEVKVELPALTDAQPKASAKIEAASLKELADATKPLVLASGNTEVTVPNSVLKAVAGNIPDSLTISVGISKSTDVNGAVSEVYEFTITTVKDGKTSTVSVFSEPVEVTVEVADSIKDPRKVAAYYINESTGSLEYVGGKYRDGKLTFTTNHFSKFVVIESNLTFGDITSHWAKEKIEVLASRKVTSGKTASTFNPEDILTRAEFATLLVRALNIPTTSYEGTFSDVTEKDSWSVLQIEAAHRAGIVYGDQGKFNPQDKVTREQMTAMIVRAIEYKDASLLKETTTAHQFADDNSISTYAKDAVQKAFALNIIKGVGSNKFAPLKDTTRAEAAVVLYELLNLLEEL